MNQPQASFTGLVLLIGVMSMPTPGAQDAQPPPEQRRLERLSRLAKLWGTVRYLHPFLAYKELDWDAPLVKAIPKVSAAPSVAAYADAVSEMLAALGDPATGLVPQSDEGKTASGEPHPVASWIDEKILLVRITNYALLERDPGGAMSRMTALVKEINRSEGIVFDLRALAPAKSQGHVTGIFGPIGNALVSHEIVGPVERSILHSGYTPQTGMTSGGYQSSFAMPAATRFVPVRGAKPRRVAFVVNARSELPPVALALQGSGDGVIVAEGPISDALFVTTTLVDLGEGLMARVRASDFVGTNGPEEVSADIEVAPSSGAEATIPSYAAALKFVRGKGGEGKPPRVARSLPSGFVARLDQTYKEMKYPSREFRLLAVMRFWNVIHYFFPYKHLMGEDWDAVLLEFIPKIEAAQNAREYALTLAEMATHTHDSHVSVRADALNEYFGTASPGLAVREIEGEVVVTGIGNNKSVKSSGIAIGDIVLKVDGEPVRDRMRRLGRYVTASTPQASSYVIVLRLLAGAPGSTLTLFVRDREGQEREHSLRRSEPGIFFDAGGKGAVTRMLDGKIGYADLARLAVGQVDAMFEQFKDTKGIIFDMRGYPRGTAWAIAPRINTNAARVAAEFHRPLVGGGDLSNGSFIFRQPIPSSDGKPLYRGKTVMLIDERAISQSEHTGLFFEAANGTTFVGSPSNGANGDVTTLTVPGGIVISFSGHDVRHADGRQLQRVGLVPHIEVRPTIAGVRAGGDEVLERALQYLSLPTQNAPSRNPR